MGLTWNKALGGGVAATLLSLLGLLAPFASHVPVLAAVVGVGTLILTWFTPKNADPKSPTS